MQSTTSNPVDVTHIEARPKYPSEGESILGSSMPSRCLNWSNDNLDDLATVGIVECATRPLSHVTLDVDFQGSMQCGSTIDPRYSMALSSTSSSSMPPPAATSLNPNDARRLATLHSSLLTSAVPATCTVTVARPTVEFTEEGTKATWNDVTSGALIVTETYATRHRAQLCSASLLLVDAGTGFVKWKEVLGANSVYVSNEVRSHTVRSDQSRTGGTPWGLTFARADAALTIAHHMQLLLAKFTHQEAAGDNRGAKSTSSPKSRLRLFRPFRTSRRQPPTAARDVSSSRQLKGYDISLPCEMEHLVHVSASFSPTNTKRRTLPSSPKTSDYYPA